MYIKTFDNGLKLVLEPIEHARSAAITIFIKSGSRYETMNLSGISHFVEHLIFKGTSTRSSQDIAEQMDEIGGQLNAYTTKEYTCVYALALYSHVGQAFSIIADMVLNSVFRESDIDTERSVILEEISMSEDNSEEYIAELSHQNMWANSMLGAEIAGTRKSVTGIAKNDIEQHVERFYNPKNIIISISGKYNENEILDKVNNTFGKISRACENIEVDTPIHNTGVKLYTKKLEQTHIVLATKGLAVNNEARYANGILVNILGGSSSSRLYRRIREELGLCYSVYTFSVSHINAGAFGIYTAIAHQNQVQYFEELFAILQDITNSITAGELNRTKEQFKAGLVMNLESSSARASTNGRMLMLQGKIISEDEVIESIDKVNLEHIRQVTEQVLDLKTANLTVLGKPLDNEFYKQYIM